MKLVLLHGWACDSRTWEPLLTGLEALAEVSTIDLSDFDPQAVDLSESALDTLVDQIAEQLPSRCVLLGWSLGGMLAVKIAARHAEKVSSLITLASNVCFTARGQWGSAMEPEVFQQFFAACEKNEAQTLKRFCALSAQGDERERLVLKKLRAQLPPSNELEHSRNLDWLSVLNALDNRRDFSQLKMPGLHVFGERDALVPVSVEREIAVLNKKQETAVIEGSCHAIHWSQADQVLARVGEFLEAQRFHLDKMRVAQSFSKAAATYDTVAQLQRDVGEHLFLEYVPEKDEASMLVDLGCGTGCFTEKLQSRFPNADVVGLDIAQGMLNFAREHKPSLSHWLCADAENLPLADNSVDMMFSSLAIQWCEDNARLFAEIRRVLKPGGKFYVSTLGPETLHELRLAWQAVDSEVHVNRFYSSATMQQNIGDSGLKLLTWQRQERVLFYPLLKNLTHELKALGAHNVNQGKPSGLTGRQRIQDFRKAYEAFRREEGLPATYEVYYGVLQA